ncbi:MAG: TRAP transporter substrate-binding protein [Gammaproteobacteria bacterium]|nr:MAG: TRAP transporter substrate-binding protein [Gammaproteobacteria bacterium]
MKSKIYIFLAILVLFATSTQAAVFKIATIAPDGSSWMKNMRAGAAEVEKHTQGRVKFKFYPGGVMGSDRSVLRKIRIRQLQGGAVTVGSVAHVYPDIQIYSLPLLFRSLKEIDYVRKRIDPQLIKGLERKGFVNFGFAEGGFAYLMSNKPVRSIQDLNTEKVWVPSGDQMGLTVFRNAGISPVPLQLADVMTGLQTGLINTITAPSMAAIALQWYTRVKYLTDAPLSYTAGILIIDRKAFNKLSPGDRKMVRNIMTKTYIKMNRQNRIDNQKARSVLQGQGIKFIKPSAKAMESWRIVAKRSQQELAKKGQFNPSTLKKILGLLATYRKKGK